MGTARTTLAVVLAAIALAIPGWSGAQTTTSSSITSSTTTTFDHCLNDLVQIVTSSGSVECRRPNGELVCILHVGIPLTCPPSSIDGPFATTPPGVTTSVPVSPRVILGTGQSDPAPTRSPVRFTG
ncbi:MAG TPA: hypothetical protein VF045_01610 [Acidimicrobiales bacterium]